MGCSASKFEIDSTNTLKDKPPINQIITDGDEKIQPKAFNGVRKTSKSFDMGVKVGYFE